MMTRSPYLLKFTDLDRRMKAEFLYSHVLTRSQDLALSEVERLPVLADVLRVWQAAAGQQGVPREIDPLDLPRTALRHVMLVDLSENPRDAVIRLAGTLPCELYGGELRNMSVNRFFGRADAEKVLVDLFRVAESGGPLLTQRSYVSINGKLWAYTRLLLPLRPDGRSTTRIMKLIEPNSFHMSANTA